MLLITFESEAFATLVFYTCSLLFLVLAFNILKFFDKLIWKLFKIFFKKQELKIKSKKLLTLRDYLKETTFVFDPEDGNLLTSKKDPKLSIRVSRGNGVDDIKIFTNIHHEFDSGDEACMRNHFSCIRNLYYKNDSHEIQILKSPAEKWETFAQEMIEIIFDLYVDKYHNKD